MFKGKWGNFDSCLDENKSNVAYADIETQFNVDKLMTDEIEIKFEILRSTSVISSIEKFMTNFAGRHKIKKLSKNHKIALYL